MLRNPNSSFAGRVARRAFGVCVTACLVLLSQVGCAQEQTTIPQEFPHFVVPGHEHQMARLRELYWLHYPGSAPPRPTLWDEWLTDPALWPALSSNQIAQRMRLAWRNALTSRVVDSEGYVATHQHASITHTYGWPFPMWTAGLGGWGWHFSFKDTVIPPFRPDRLSTQSLWKMQGAADQGIDEEGWNLTLTSPDAALVTPARTIDTVQAPFLQLRWRARDLEDAQPYVEWSSLQQPQFGPERRVYFDPVPTSSSIAYTMIPVFRHPKWTGNVDRLRICFANRRPGAAVTVQAFMTHYDSRHNVNNQSFIRGCATYFWWTRDLNFLRQNITRMRLALCFLMVEHGALKQGYIQTAWPGHDGRTSLLCRDNGTTELLYGHGIGNNYWDLLPFGWKDAYATLRYYDSLLCMAQLEREILSHPEWNMPGGALQLDPLELTKHATQVKSTANNVFWNRRTGRFVGCIDADNCAHDYGFTFLNCEAVYYGLATTEHAQSILSWLSGQRLVKGDTAQGADIYHWRFAPRATTVRNLDYYNWVWSHPDTIAWGGQVQDGGAVLGFSYHDLMARLKTRGADDAWARLSEILAWFDEVQLAGGYRNYYDGKREGTLQGMGTAGGLGVDAEFYESVMVPQVMLRGFLGFEPTGEGFRLHPQLPSQWPELMVDRIGWRDMVLRVRVSREVMVIVKEQGSCEELCKVELPEGTWKVAHLGASAELLGQPAAVKGSALVDWNEASALRLERIR